MTSPLISISSIPQFSPPLYKAYLRIFLEAPLYKKISEKQNIHVYNLQAKVILKSLSDTCQGDYQLRCFLKRPPGGGASPVALHFVDMVLSTTHLPFRKAMLQHGAGARSTWTTMKSLGPKPAVGRHIKATPYCKSYGYYPPPFRRHLWVRMNQEWSYSFITSHCWKNFSVWLEQTSFLLAW